MPGTQTNMQTLTGLSSLADQYDGYVIDLWGTVHDACSLTPVQSPASKLYGRQGSAW